MDHSLAEYAKSLDFMPPDQLLEAELAFRLRRELPTHTSDLIDAFVIARGFEMSLAQAGALLAHLFRRLDQGDLS